MWKKKAPKSPEPPPHGPPESGCCTCPCHKDRTPEPSLEELTERMRSHVLNLRAPNVADFADPRKVHAWAMAVLRGGEGCGGPGGDIDSDSSAYLARCVVIAQQLERQGGEARAFVFQSLRNHEERQQAQRLINEMRLLAQRLEHNLTTQGPPV